jgi:hypothetical protein
MQGCKYVQRTELSNYLNTIYYLFGMCSDYLRRTSGNCMSMQVYIGLRAHGAYCSDVVRVQYNNPLLKPEVIRDGWEDDFLRATLATTSVTRTVEGTFCPFV